MRELANVVEHATILCDELPITPEHLPRVLTTATGSLGVVSGPMTLREMELLAIDQAMQRRNGNKSRVAEELGISLKTLYNKLNQADPQRKSA